MTYRVLVQCDSCAQQATVRIPSGTGHVCLTHAIAFWTALLAYSRQIRRAQRKRERLFERLQELKNTDRGSAPARGPTTAPDTPSITASARSPTSSAIPSTV